MFNIWYSSTISEGHWSHLFNPLLAELSPLLLHLVSFVYLGKANWLFTLITLLAAHREAPIRGIVLLLPFGLKPSPWMINKV